MAIISPRTRRAITLLKDYQRKHPEIVNGERQVGRIAPKKRIDFERQMLETMVPNKSLVRLFFTNSVEAEDKLRAIANLLVKQKGGKKEAIEYVDALEGYLSDKGREIVLHFEGQKMVALDSQKEHIVQSGHYLNNALTRFSAKVLQASLMLDKK